MSNPLTRLVILAALIVTVQAVTARYGPQYAPVAFLFPAASVLGLIAVHAAAGRAGVTAAALAGLTVVPAVAGFLGGAYLVSRSGGPLWAAVAAGLGVYAAVAALTLWSPAWAGTVAVTTGAVVATRGFPRVPHPDMAVMVGVVTGGGVASAVVHNNGSTGGAAAVTVTAAAVCGAALMCAAAAVTASAARHEQPR